MSGHVELPKDYVFHTWSSVFYEAGDRMVRPFMTCLDGESKNHMHAVGFVDIHETRLKLPVGGWVKDPSLKYAGTLFHCAVGQDMKSF